MATAPPGIETSNNEAIAETIHKIQVFIYPRRLRCKEFFTIFDHLHCGRVTAPHFSRALDSIGLRFTEQECLDLVEHFTQAGPHVTEPQVVNYVKFCEVVDEIFADGGPDSPTMTSSPSGTLLKHFTPNSVEEEERVMNVLHRLAALCKTRRMVLKECFTDMDRNTSTSPSRLSGRRGGKVTRNQFMRLFPFVKEFPRTDLELLADRYNTDCGNVHYMALHNDVSDFISTGAQPFPTSDLQVRHDDTAWAHHNVDPVAKLRAKVVERRIRIVEPFQDFDALRKGVCTVRQLNTVFTILNIEKELFRSEIEEIVKTYVRDDGLFCYRDFCADIDKDFTTVQLEKSPTAKVRMPDAVTTSPARRNQRVLSLEQEVKLGQVMDRLRYIVSSRGMLLNPTFTDMDRMHKGYITKGQFVRCLDMLSFGLDDESVSVLCAKYCDRGNHTDVSYMGFIRAVDMPDEDQQKALQEHQMAYQEWSPPKYFDHRGRVGKEGIPVAVSS